MRTLLLLNGSHSDIPLILAAKRLGFHVTTTGNDASLTGHRYADAYVPGDFSDKESMLALAQQLGVDAVCACANDFGTTSAAYVAEKLGLPGHDTYETCLTLHHKDRFKKLVQALDVPTPRATDYADEAAALQAQHPWPVMVKPIDLTGGKGISKVLRAEEYAPAVRHAFALSRSKRIVVEEFIAGSYHSLTTFLRGGKVVFHFSDDEHAFLNPYLVSTSAAPATGFAAVRDTLIAAAEKIAAALALVDGVFHMQYVQRGDVPYILEITRRCSGDLYPYPVQHATGVDWAQWIVRAEAGMDVGGLHAAPQQGFNGRHCIMAAGNGVVQDVLIADEIAVNIYDRMEWWKPGDVIDQYMVQKLGILLLFYGSEAEMRDKTARINQLVQVVVA